ncbi:MAG: hypothetical protein ACJAZS_000813 [Alteromonas naphthalenivorans]|jgi:hypothetical protein
MINKLILCTLLITGNLMAKRNITEIVTSLEQAQQTLKPGQKYYHYKTPDRIYTIESLSVSHDKNQILVNYATEYDGKKILWARVLEDFLSLVNVDEKEIKKFERIY